MRLDEVRAWLNDPITQQFIAIVQDEIRTAREACVAAACRDPAAAAEAAAECKALRSLLTEGLTTLADEKETQEVLKGAGNEKDPEELHPARLADALSQGDGDEGVDRDPHA